MCSKVEGDVNVLRRFGDTAFSAYNNPDNTLFHNRAMQSPVLFLAVLAIVSSVDGVTVNVPVFCNYTNSNGVSMRCPIGYACNITQLEGQAIKCNATQSCGGGTCTPELCPCGFKCPNGVAIVCQPPYYCPNEGSTAQTVCPIGFKCDQPKMCAPVHCPSGTYVSCPGKQSCDSCPAGRFCPNVTTSILCPAGYSCIGGVSAPTRCQAGRFCHIGSSAPKPCPPGFYCVRAATVNVICPAGSFCPLGSSSPSACKISARCPSGSSADVSVSR